MTRCMSKHFAIAVAACSLMLVTGAGAANAEADSEALVNALNAVFGKHDGMRAAHTNGICVKGSFTPSVEAAGLSKAPQFNKGVARSVIGRFSMGGGNPDASNAQKDNARGLAMHFDIGNGNTTDLVLLSAPVFLAKNPEDFLQLLQTVATKDGDKIGAYFKAHPEGTQQGAWLNARPVPASYAAVTYLLWCAYLHGDQRGWAEASGEAEGDPGGRRVRTERRRGKGQGAGLLQTRADRAPGKGTSSIHAYGRAGRTRRSARRSHGRLA